MTDWTDPHSCCASDWNKFGQKILHFQETRIHSHLPLQTTYLSAWWIKIRTTPEGEGLVNREEGSKEVAKVHCK